MMARQELCHFDVWRTNLFARSSPEGQEETVATDWAFAGIGAVGLERTFYCRGGNTSRWSASSSSTIWMAAR
jgi:hypothetical protein